MQKNDSKGQSIIGKYWTMQDSKPGPPD